VRRGGMKAVDLLRRAMRNSDSSAQSLAEILAGIANQSDLLNRKLEAVVAGLNRIDGRLRSQSRLMEQLIGPHDKSVPLGYVPEEDIAKYPVAVAPICDIPYPIIDLAALLDPLPAISSSLEFAAASEFFLHNAAATRSLVSALSNALLYALVRNLQPEHVVEIGTYMAGTSEAICRALERNGKGVLHTTDPFAERAPAVLSQWPSELRRHIRFYALDSVLFFSEIINQRDTRADLVFVDGNHEYEFAAFDIACAARILRPGGFIVVDNVSQAGPFGAAQDFLALNPQYTECRVTNHAYDATKAFDRDRSNIPGTDLIVVRGPANYAVGDRPVTFGEFQLRSTGFSEIVVLLGDQVCDGTLHVQGVLRGFSDGQEPIEQVSSSSRTLSARDAGAELKIELPMDVGSGFDIARVEIWLTWTGAVALLIRQPPSVVS
jgi:predicted O-methyltransferase YrrM